MKIKRFVVVAGALCLSATAQAQVSDVVGSLTGAHSGATNALSGLSATAAPLLDGLNLNSSGLSGVTAPLANSLTNVTNGLPTSGLNFLSSNPTVLPRPASLFAAPTSEQLTGDLPAAFMISPTQLDPATLQAVLDDAAIAFPAGALPNGTLIPIASLNGLDPALISAVTNNQIASNLLPDDLPIPSNVLDPGVVTQVLSSGIPAALLPKEMPIELGQLSGL